MKQRILVATLIIGLATLSAGAATSALFNDTETSEDNPFQAGKLDLTVDWEEHYNGELIETQELTNDPGPIFDLRDIKPGDHGEATVSLHLEDNPGWIWMNVTQTTNWDNSCTEPERREEPGGCHSDGELGEHLMFIIWYDDGDNVLDEDEHVLFEGTAHELGESSIGDGILLDSDPSTEEVDAFPGSETHYLGIKWHVPLETGNVIQDDEKTFDFTFYTEQERHNPQDVDRPKEPEDVYYQVDLVGGEPIEDLSESTYHSEGRMQRFFHGGPGTPIDNESEPDQVKTGTGGPDCVDSDPFTVDTGADTATVDFTVHDLSACDSGTVLSLVSYSKPYGGWIADRADEQEIFDSLTVNHTPGEHSMTVDIPDAN